MKEKRLVTLNSPKEKGERIITLKSGRNNPCSCGSGKKQKNCCGEIVRHYSLPQLTKSQSN